VDPFLERWRGPEDDGPDNDEEDAAVLEVADDLRVPRGALRFAIGDFIEQEHGGEQDDADERDDFHSASEMADGGNLRANSGLFSDGATRR